MCFFSIELLGQDVFNSKYSVKTNLFPNEAIPQFLLEENPLSNELQNENACSNVMLRKFVDSNFPAGSFLQRKFYTEANDLSLYRKDSLTHHFKPGLYSQAGTLTGKNGEIEMKLSGIM